MSKIKKLLALIISRWSTWSLKKRLIFGGGSFGLIIIIYLGISLTVVSRSELALANLRESIEREPVCHENCLVTRSAAEQMIAAKLEISSPLQKRLTQYLNDPATSLAFKKELVKISALGYESNNQPVYLKDYVNNMNGDPAVQAEIITLFKQDISHNPSLISNFQMQINNKNVSVAKRIAALKALVALGDDSLITYYFTNLATSSDVVFQEELIKAISNIKNKAVYFQVDQLLIIKNLALNPQTSAYLRADLVLLLSDYYNYFPRETIAVLKNIYQQAPSGDAISRAFAADFINRMSGQKTVVPPPVSTSQWDAYYNNQ